MKFYVNEKFFSVHRKFYVKDENGKDVYEISSKIISIGDKTTIKDMNGKEISYIEQRMIHFTSNYDVFINKKLVCNISKKFQIFRNDYKIDNGYSIDGEFLMLNFSIYDQKGNEIGSVKKKIVTIMDKYEIIIKNKNNIPLVLSIVVAIANDVNRIQHSLIGEEI